MGEGNLALEYPLHVASPTPNRCSETLRSGKDASDTRPKSQGRELTKNEADHEESK